MGASGDPGIGVGILLVLGGGLAVIGVLLLLAAFR